MPNLKVTLGIGWTVMSIRRGMFYRLAMKLAHKYNWHYAPPIYPEGDTQLWCQWCGFRQTVKRCGEMTKPTTQGEASKQNLTGK